MKSGFAYKPKAGTIIEYAEAEYIRADQGFVEFYNVNHELVGAVKLDDGDYVLHCNAVGTV